jgi:hypothetical protein
VQTVVNWRVPVRRKFFGSGTIPGVKNQEEFTQSIERVRVEGVVLSEWFSWGKGFWGGMFWLEKCWHRRASLGEGIAAGYLGKGIERVGCTAYRGGKPATTQLIRRRKEDLLGG